MLQYDNFRKQDLAPFATNRKLEVRSTSKSLTSPGPTRKDYTQALMKDDESYVFRFFDLPPELRTQVYNELLVLQDSFTCYPQILRTCKEVSQEASKVLYGENLIEAKIYYDGVFVHGQRRGILQNFRWPLFLRKVQWLKLEVIGVPGRRYLANSGPICSIIYSLCAFLHRGTGLRSLEIDIRRLEDVSQSQGTVHQFRDSIPMMLCTLKFLPKIKRLRVKGTTVYIDQIPEPSPFVIDTASKIAAKNAQLLIQSIRLAEATCPLIRGDVGANRLLSVRMKKNLPAKLPIDDVFNFNGLIQMFITVMEAVRAEWHDHDSKRPSKQCKEQVTELVRLEIEIRIRLHEMIAAMFD